MKQHPNFRNWNQKGKKKKKESIVFILGYKMLYVCGGRLDLDIVGLTIKERKFHESIL